MVYRTVLLAGTIFITSCVDGETTDNTPTDTGGDAGMPSTDAGVQGPSYTCAGVDLLLDDSKDGVAQAIEWSFLGNPDEQTLIDTDPEQYPPKVLSIKTICNDTDREITVKFADDLSHSGNAGEDCGACQLAEPDGITEFYYGLVYDTFDKAQAIAADYPAYIGSQQSELTLSPGEGGTLITQLKQYSEGCVSVCGQPYPSDETVTASITVTPTE